MKMIRYAFAVATVLSLSANAFAGLVCSNAVGTLGYTVTFSENRESATLIRAPVPGISKKVEFSFKEVIESTGAHLYIDKTGESVYTVELRTEKTGSVKLDVYRGQIKIVRLSCHQDEDTFPSVE